MNDIPSKASNRTVALLYDSVIGETRFKIWLKPDADCFYTLEDKLRDLVNTLSRFKDMALAIAEWEGVVTVQAGRVNTGLAFVVINEFWKHE